jgi:uncharacterized membrane protein YidH (DUF202 family)
LLLGLLLIFLGYERSRTVSGQIHRLFTVTEKNRTTWCYVGGAALVAAGVVTLLNGRR